MSGSAVTTKERRAPTTLREAPRNGVAERKALSKTPAKATKKGSAEYSKPAPGAVNDPQTRSCLTCGRSFTSEWAGERICRRCKSSSTWRQG